MVAMVRMHENAPNLQGTTGLRVWNGMAQLWPKRWANIFRTDLVGVRTCQSLTSVSSGLECTCVLATHTSCRRSPLTDLPGAFVASSTAISATLSCWETPPVSTLFDLHGRRDERNLLVHCSHAALVRHHVHLGLQGICNASMVVASRS